MKLTSRHTSIKRQFRAPLDGQHENSCFFALVIQLFVISVDEGSEAAKVLKQVIEIFSSKIRNILSGILNDRFGVALLTDAGYDENQMPYWLLRIGLFR